MLVKLQTSIPEKAQAKVNHNKAIAALTSILNQDQGQDSPDQLSRLGAGVPALRVTMQTTTTQTSITDPTDLETM